MPSLPILLVFAKAPPESLTAALEREGYLHHVSSPHDAARSVNDGWAELVVCERVPAWQALMARVHTAGGAGVLWGPEPDPIELRLITREDFESAQTGSELLAAVRRAEARLRARREAPEHLDDLRERVECAGRVSRFAQSIALQIDLPHVVEEAIARTRDLCDADGASLLLVDPQTGALGFDVGSGGVSDRLQSTRLLPGQGVAGHVARSAQPVLISSARESPFFDRGCDAQSGFITGSIIATPLVVAGDLVGVLEAVRGEDRPPFVQAHLRRLLELAPHVSIAVHNAQITARLKDAQAQVLRDNADLERRISLRTEQIARAQREWEATFDAISEPLAVYDGCIVRRANRAWAERAGVPVQQVTGRTCHELFAGRTSTCPGCPIAEGDQEKEMTGEIQLPGNVTFAFSAFRFPSESGNSMVVHYRDVTGQRQLERRLRESERLASVGQLASGAAHEINNPLGFLASNLRNLREQWTELGEAMEAARTAQSLLTAGRTKEAAASLSCVGTIPEDAISEGCEMLDDALNGARRVAEIVRALRELARQQVSHEGNADINASVTRAVRAEFGPSPQNLDLALNADGAAAIDPLQLDQALGHILRNAKQAICGSQRVRIRTQSRTEDVLIEIEDEGSGILPEHVGRVFEPFFTTRGVGKGIGLGLTATWGIVQRHGGHVEVSSRPGSGTTFMVTLPRGVPDALPDDLDDGESLDSAAV